MAYVDSDPVVVSHARALLHRPGVTSLAGDLADPDAILADPDLLHLIDVAEPVAVILAMVLHFFDAATARSIVAAFAETIAPGSCVVISVGSGDEQTGRNQQQPNPVPTDLERLQPLPSRHACHSRPPGWRAPARVPTDPEVLRKARAALKHL